MLTLNKGYLSHLISLYDIHLRQFQIRVAYTNFFSLSLSLSIYIYIYIYSFKNSYKYAMLTPQKCYGKHGGTKNWNNGSSFLRYDPICHL